MITATADQQKAAAEAQAAKTTAEEANKAYKAVLPQAEEAKKKKEALKKQGLKRGSGSPSFLTEKQKRPCTLR
ncbi:MAG: hypothetical protein V8R49_03770 [Duodenibacillus massiliensis]